MGVITVRSLRSRTALVLPALVLAALAPVAGLVAGCGASSPAANGPASRATSTAPPVPSATPSPVPATSAPPGWPATERTAAGSQTGYLTAIAVGQHSGYDRVVFTFSGAIPGYTVGYVSEVVSDAKGDVVELPGQAFLHVVFHPSSGYQTYTGPGSITASFPALLQLRAAGDFEGYLSYGIGLSQRVGFRVFTLTQPFRVVIDMAHPA